METAETTLLDELQDIPVSAEATLLDKPRDVPVLLFIFKQRISWYIKRQLRYGGK